MVSDVAIGLDDRRPKLHRLLDEPRVGTILVERRDRLARFGAGMVTTIPEARGNRPPVVEDKEAADDLGRDMTEILACFSARFCGRRRTANRARKAIITEKIALFQTSYRE